MKRYLFAKFLNDLNVDELMESVAATGLDGPTALIRNGYWVEDNNMANDLPVFVKAAEKAGLEVKFASTGFSMESLIEDDTPVKILVDNGITTLRLGYIGRNNPEIGVRDLYAYTRSLIEKTANTAACNGIKALLQLHGGQYPHNSTAAWPLVKDLPSEHIGIMIDPGNNLLQEGFEFFDYQIDLLSEYIGAMGVKDAMIQRKANGESSDKNWERHSAPVYEGINNWPEIFGFLKEKSFEGPLIFMPFYDPENTKEHLRKLKLEVEYISSIRSEESV